MAQYTDDLTNLNNMVYLKEHYSEYINRNNEKYMIAIDFRSLKYINDNFGHDIGDSCLIAFSNIAKKIFEDSIVIRRSGDEFIVVTNSDMQTVQTKLKAIYDEIKVKHDSGHLKALFSFNSGIVVAEDNFEDTALKADLTMYQAKRNDKLISIYNEDIMTKYLEKNDFLNQVDHMYKNDEFNYLGRPLYDAVGNPQNIYDLTITDKNGISVFSGERYDILRINNRIKKLDQWNLKKCLEEIIPLNREYEYIININHQTVFAKEYDIVEELKEKIQENSIDKGKLCISIDTRHYQGTAEDIIKVMSEIKKIGVKVGIGQINLESQQFTIPILSLVNVDYVKVGKEILDAAVVDKRVRLVLANIVDLFDKLGATTIFTKIETEPEKQLVTSLAKKILIRKK